MMQMKHFFLSFIFVFSSTFIFAQNDDKTVTLNAVTVQGAKAVSKADGQILYPTEAQKSASNNGYGILQKLSLPNIRIDDVAHTVTVLDNRGGVQLRINDVIVGRQEMLALDPKIISKVDFIDTPGVRYGDDVAYVINIITKRNDSGYTIGADVTPSVTSQKFNGMAYGKWNNKKSELSLSYDYNGYRLHGAKQIETTDYTLTDGTVFTILRNDISSLRRSENHELKLTYNLADSTSYVFQASLSQSFTRRPDNYSIKDIVASGSTSTATSRTSGTTGSPVLDVYYFRQLSSRQSITANAVGTYIASKSDNYYDEGTPYIYNVDGNTASVLSEVIYENRLKPFTLSAGINGSYKYTRNNYVGDASAQTLMHQSKLYAFSEVKGAVSLLRYFVGLGASYINYDQNHHHYHLLTFRPKTMLAYNIAQGLQLRYTFEMKERASRIAMISDAMIQTNSMEYTLGNPDLKPSRDTEHTLYLSYNTARWQTFVQCFYRHCSKPNMAHYQRTADDKFVYTQINQKSISLLHAMAYASYWILPEKLQAEASGGMQRCFNYGFDYTHFYTSWFWQTNLTAYLGKFTLQAYADNGNRWLEGETRGYSGAYTALKTSFMHKDWQFSLTWANPFSSNYKEAEAELLNLNLHRLSFDYDRDSGNHLALNITWHLNRGKKHQSASKTISLKDTDSGIIGRAG